jgi:hypothetical protein
VAVLRDIRNTACINLMIIQEGPALPQIAGNTANLSVHPCNLMERSDNKQPHTRQAACLSENERGSVKKEDQ